MSKPRPDLDNSKEKIFEYLDYLYSLQYVKEVYIKGSRSPLSKKTPRTDSDWDIEILVENKLFITQPRELGLHVDLHQVKTPSKISVKYKDYG